LVECLDAGDIRLLPPPFHRPPPDPRRIGHNEDALQLEQCAADRHVLAETELRDLPEAVRLIFAAHDVDEDMRPIGSRVQERSGIIDRPDRQDIARPHAAVLA